MFAVSSDSDDDCYDKFPQRLQKLKNKLALNNLLKVEDNAENDVDSNSVSVTRRPNPDGTSLNSNSNHVSTNLSSFEINTPPEGPCTRSQLNKRKSSDLLPPEALEQVNGRKIRGRGSESSVAPAPPRGRGRGSQSSVARAPPRGRGRGRGRKSRGANQNNSPRSSTSASVAPSQSRSPRGGRGSRRNNQGNLHNQQQIITYSVGNTDEYPDASDDQVLFSNKNIASTSAPSNTDLDEYLTNKELSVKVYWQHSEVFKFNIRRLQKLTQIFDFFVNKEGVTRDCLLFTYNYKRTNKILRPDDTPDSIDYNITQFIEGGIINKQFALNPNVTPQKKGFMIKFQFENRKNIVELSVDKDKKLQIAMLKCAEHFEIPISELIFEFDGETIRGTDIPSDLDMESGDCIDVKILKKMNNNFNKNV